MSHGWQGYGLRFGPIATVAADENGWFGAHFVGFGDSALRQVEWQTPYGCGALPVDGTETEACNGFFSLDGEFAWLGHDARYSSKCPLTHGGDAALWTYRGQHLYLDTDSYTCTLTAPLSDGKSHLIQVGVVAGERVINILHADGVTKIEITPTTVTVSGSTIHVNAANVLLGTAPGRQVATVGDLVSVSVPPMANSGGLVVPVGVPPTAVGGVPALGQIISGRAGVLA